MGGLLKLKDKLARLLGLQKENKGFTLIEVVIVLAIAGLIFVVVFLAVGAAQRSRRDTETSSAASRLLAAVDQYVANSGGAMPANCAALTNYWSTGGYVCGAANPTAANTTALNLGLNQVCNAAGTAFQAGTRSAGVIYWSEAAGAVRCVDNN